jgi:hypothetical protein
LDFLYRWWLHIRQCEYLEVSVFLFSVYFVEAFFERTMSSTNITDSSDRVTQGGTNTGPLLVFDDKNEDPVSGKIDVRG